MIRCVIAAFVLALVLPLGLPGPAPAFVAGSGTEIGRLDPGLEHDPSAAVSTEQHHRIDIHDRQRRAAAPEASHVPTLTGPARGPAPDVPVVPPIEARLPPLPDRPIATEIARPVPATARPDRLSSGTFGASAGIDRALDGLAEPLVVQAWSYPPPESAAAPEPGAPSLPPGPPLIAAGTAHYAVLDLAVDSRHAAPVVATLLSGPLRGARLVGSFEHHGDAMLLRFGRLATRTGDMVAVEAWAVSPDCGCYGIAGTVDHHWFARVALPAAAAFAGGFLRASTRPETVLVINGTTVTSTSAAAGNRTRLGEAAAGAIDRAAPLLSQTAPSGPTLTIAAGTEVLLLFTRVVLAAGRSQ